MEDVKGRPQNDRLIGNEHANRLFGLEGGDTLEGDQGRGRAVQQAATEPTCSIRRPAASSACLATACSTAWDCGELARSDGDPGDLAFRVLADGDLVNDCAIVIDN